MKKKDLYSAFLFILLYDITSCVLCVRSAELLFVLYNLSCRRTTGLFVLNGAEGWVDVKKDGEGMLSSLSNMVSGSTKQKQVGTT